MLVKLKWHILVLKFSLATWYAYLVTIIWPRNNPLNFYYFKGVIRCHFLVKPWRSLTYSCLLPFSSMLLLFFLHLQIKHRIWISISHFLFARVNKICIHANLCRYTQMLTNVVIKFHSKYMWVAFHVLHFSLSIWKIHLYCKPVV